jgi:hypothetical protein
VGIHPGVLWVLGWVIGLQGIGVIQGIWVVPYSLELTRTPKIC